MEIERVTGLKPWLIVYAILWPPVAFFFNNWMISLGRWWLFPAIVPLPIIWILVLFYAAEKVSPRFKLSQQEMTIFIIINFLTAGSWWLLSGLHYWTLVPLVNWNYAMFIHGKIVDPYKDVFLSKLPAFLSPNDVNQLNAFYYGGAFDFGVWLPSMVFWMIFAIALYAGNYFWGFFLRKPLIEEERLPFPGSGPGTTLLRMYYSGGEKRELFDLKKIVTKTFWIGFVFGCIVASPIIINAFLPSPWVWYIQGFEFDWTPFTESILPGALLGGYMYVTDFFIAQWIALDVLATSVLWWFIMGVIYQTIGARVGFLPWTPGMTAGALTGFAWNVGPFKWMLFDNFMTLALGIYIAYKLRRHIINVIKAGLGIDKSLPTEEEGVPYRVIVLGGIITLVIIMVLFLAGGAYAPFAIVAPLFYIVLMWGWTRAVGEQHFYPFDVYSGLAFDIGGALGGWGGRPSPEALNSIMMWSALEGPGSRMSATTMHHQYLSWKLGYEMKTLARAILTVALIVVVSNAVFAYLEWPWWYATVGGYSTARSIEYHIWFLPTPWSLTYGVPSAHYADPIGNWIYLGGGLIFLIVVYWLRAKFTWFFWNPVGMMMLSYWWWPTWLTAFIIKFVTFKVGGARLHERYVLPFSAGYLAGFGALCIIAAWLMFFTLAVPEFIARTAGP